MALSLNNLKARKKVLVEASEAILDGAEKDGNRSLTAAEQQRIDAHKMALGGVQQEINRWDEIAARREGLPTVPTGFEDWANGIPPKPPAGVEARGALAASSTAGGIGLKYRQLFGSNLSNDGWPSMQAMFAAIHSGMADVRFKQMVEGTGAGGGWLVPTQYAAEMLDAAMEDSIVMPRARIYPMTSETKKIAGFDATTNTAASLYGGLEAQWLQETGTGTPTNPKVRKIELKAKRSLPSSRRPATKSPRTASTWRAS